MSDIYLSFDGTTASCDWSIVDGQVLTGGDLETAVLVSLFTDRVLPSDQPSADGSDDPRGWWADTYQSAPLGSLLWTLERAVKSDSAALLAYAQKACLQALQWLIDDGVAAKVQAKTYWLKANEMGIEITVTEPNNRAQTFKYQWAWNKLGSDAPIPVPGSVIQTLLYVPIGSSSYLTADGQLLSVKA